VLRQAGHALLAFTVALAGGGLFYLLHLPLPWTLGSIAAAAALALSGRDWALPVVVRDLARPVIGLMAGSAFTATVVAALVHWWPVVIVVTLYTITSIGLGWLFFRNFCRWDRATAFFSAAPGGLSELTLIGGSLGGNFRTLALVHSVRIVVVVFIIPFALQLIVGHPIGRTGLGASAGIDIDLTDWLVLGACGVAGYGLGKWLRIPGGVMIPALMLSAAAHATGLTQASAPGWLVALVQVVIGSSAGARFVGTSWREISTTLVQALVWAVVLVLLTGAAAWLASRFVDHSIITLTLAFAPGGMAEMAIIAYALGTEVAFVICCQVFRILLICLSVPVVFRLGSGHSGPPPASTPGS
jgi:hypothetical protein